MNEQGLENTSFTVLQALCSAFPNAESLKSPHLNQNYKPAQKIPQCDSVHHYCMAIAGGVDSKNGSSFARKKVFSFSFIFFFLE